jgi:hypothetical protein
MNTTQERLDWHNAEALLPKPKEHVHVFKQKMDVDPESDDVYYYGQCIHCDEVDV